MNDYDCDDEELTYVPAPTRADWIASVIAMVLVGALLIWLNLVGWQ